jgi:phosphoribosylaminoimidazole-succinocarboxamide synthase
MKEAQNLVEAKDRLVVSRSRLNQKIKALGEMKKELDAAIKDANKTLSIHASDVKMERVNLQKEKALAIADKVAEYYGMSLYEVYHGWGS